MSKAFATLLTGLALVVVGCSNELSTATPDIQATLDAAVAAETKEQDPVPTSTPVPTPTPIRYIDQVDLSTQDEPRLTMRMDDGAKYSITLFIDQDEDQARCGKPRMLDSFGNVIAVLTPIDPTPTRTEYRYADTAQADGRYSVVFDNLECNVRLTGAVATIEWRIWAP